MVPPATHITILVAHIDNAIVYIGRGTASQQQSDYHEGALLVVTHRQRRWLCRVQVRAHSAMHRIECWPHWSEIDRYGYEKYMVIKYKYVYQIHSL